MKTLTNFALTLGLFGMAAQAVPQFTTCHNCTQIYDKPCATNPNVPYTQDQCGSEDWDNPFGCKDFYIRTYTCAAGGTYRTTIIVWRANWWCVSGGTAAGSACSP
jgi:hypothetical protein